MAEKDKSGRHGPPIRRYVFNWLVPIIGGLDIAARRKPALIKRVSGLIVEKAWGEIIACAGIDVMEAIKKKLQSVGDNVLAVDVAISEAKRIRDFKQALNNTDKLRGRNVNKEDDGTGENVYESLFDRGRTESAESVEIVPTRLKRKSFVLPSGIVSWKLAQTISHEQVVVLTRKDDDILIVHTKLESYYSINFEGIQEGRFLMGKIVIEYMPVVKETE